MQEGDLDFVLRWRNHPDVRIHMLTQHEIPMDAHHAWFECANKDETRLLLVIEEAGRPIGCVVFSNVGSGGAADWGFYVDPDSAPGTGRKVCATALDVAFNDLKVHKVAGQVLAFNDASIRIHLRLGFTQEGVLRKHRLINGKYHDLLIFGVLSDEWLRQNSESN